MNNELSEALLGIADAQGQINGGKLRRIKRIKAALDLGATWAQIGTALGMTEAGARQLWKRAQKDGEA